MCRDNQISISDDEDKKRELSADFGMDGIVWITTTGKLSTIFCQNCL